MVNAVDFASHVPAELQKWWTSAPSSLVDRLYRPSGSADDPFSLSAAVTALRTSAMSAPDDLVPVTFVDERSFACLVLRDSAAFGWTEGQVVRWHLDEIEVRYQGALLDTTLDYYLQSLIEEQGEAWSRGYKGVIELAEKYQTDRGEEAASTSSSSS